MEDLVHVDLVVVTKGQSMIIICILSVSNFPRPYTEIILSKHVLEILIFQMSVIGTWDIVARRKRGERIVDSPLQRTFGIYLEYDI